MTDDLRNTDRDAAKLKAIREILDDADDQSPEPPPSSPIKHRPVKVWKRRSLQRVR
jgi:hypothetical protein